jgi:hypothetical protein
MVPFMRVNFKIIWLKDMERSKNKIMNIMKEIGKRIKPTERVNITTKIILFMLENLNLDKETVKECLH